MKAVHAALQTRVAKCSRGGLPLDRQTPSGWRHPELLQHGCCWRREAGTLDDRRAPYPVAHGLDPVQDEADVPPGVAGAALGRPLEEEGEHTELDVTGDAMGRPMINRAEAQPRGLHPPEAGLDERQGLVPQASILWREGVIVGQEHILAVHPGG